MGTEGDKVERLVAAAFEAAMTLGMPSESSVSFPIPVRGDRLEGHVFLAVARPIRGGTNTELFRPVTRIRLDWEDAQVLGVDQGHAADYEPAGLLLQPEFAVEPSEEDDLRHLDARHTLNRFLEEVGPLYARGDDDPGLRGGCLDAFRRMVPEGIRSLYEELNPDFFRWLEVGPAPTPVASGEPASWSPTHLVPPEGMAAWGTPDPQAAIVANLDPGLPLKILETLGDWAHVEASNGWQGWVDGRILRTGG